MISLKKVCSFFVKLWTVARKEVILVCGGVRATCRNFIRASKLEKRVKLASVKHGIYNPLQASWKQNERDDRLGMLSNEHVRSSLPAGTELPEEPFYQYNASSYYIPNYEVLPLYHTKWQEDENAEALSFLNNPQLDDQWRTFKKYLPLGYLRIFQIPQVKSFEFLNYHVRYQKPEVRSSWKSELKKERILNR